MSRRWLPSRLGLLLPSSPRRCGPSASGELHLPSHPTPLAFCLRSRKRPCSHPCSTLPHSPNQRGPSASSACGPSLGPIPSASRRQRQKQPCAHPCSAQLHSPNRHGLLAS